MMTEKEKEKLDKVVDILLEDDGTSVFDTLAMLNAVYGGIIKSILKNNTPYDQTERAKDIIINGFIERMKKDILDYNPKLDKK